MVFLKVAKIRKNNFATYLPTQGPVEWDMLKETIIFWSLAFVDMT